MRFASDERLIVEAPGGKPDEVVDVLDHLRARRPAAASRARFTFVEKDEAMPSVNDLDTNKDKRRQEAVAARSGALGAS